MYPLTKLQEWYKCHYGVKRTMFYIITTEFAWIQDRTAQNYEATSSRRRIKGLFTVGLCISDYDNTNKHVPLIFLAQFTVRSKETITNGKAIVNCEWALRWYVLWWHFLFPAYFNKPNKSCAYSIITKELFLVLQFCF